ncbi:BZ3500_MvSof-1268-A1-R1_Chr3-1g05524 [Microbotryum saponariae]|uniref:BZ3500_MvSof-1268-A1-R1_Chr3-1g05524 protein n=1 Tax=Microbotryum saponariae TaxID=289078 RepID=A0A2X0KZU6_9BASI|nr:BZ3500_MvSof-1268-A1-R1_Chr3-1g05524 [Microbotryum saponariae]SDA04715.1 BZ3501_MvSof-1269-A2-R1_Chr3-1g05195 [Microbotryum saponariae]
MPARVGDDYGPASTSSSTSSSRTSSRGHLRRAPSRSLDVLPSSTASSDAGTSTSTNKSTKTSTSTSTSTTVRTSSDAHTRHHHLRTSSSSSSLLSASVITANGHLARPSLASARRCSSSNARWATTERQPSLAALMLVEQRKLQREQLRRTNSAIALGRHRSRSATSSTGRRTNGFHHKAHQGEDQDGQDHGDGHNDDDHGEEDAGDDDDANEDWRDMMQWRNDPPQSAILHPPLYGRPGPQPSPDLFTTLLQPLLSLSRPPSPSLAMPPTRSSPVSLVDHPTMTSTRKSTPVFSSPTTFATSTLAPPSTEIPDRSASSLPAQFPPRASTDPGPTVESQGFVLYIGSGVAWILYLVCEWALLVPAWTIMLAAFIYFSYISINLFITPPINSLDTLTDPFAFILVPGEEDPHPLITNSVLLPPDAVPPIHDLPVSLVNRVVFGDFRRKVMREDRKEADGVR